MAETAHAGGRGRGEGSQGVSGSLGVSEREFGREWRVWE